VRDALELKSNDALWLVLMALQHYQRQYEQVPARIEDAAQRTLTTFRDTAETTALAATENAREQLAAAVAAAARDVARHVGVAHLLQWIVVAIVSVAGCVLLLGLYIHMVGEEAGLSIGYAKGYEEAKDEKAAAAWAATREGQVAFRLAEAGSMHKLGSCSEPGWYIEKGVCYPGRAADGLLYGWHLGSRSRR
jgi:hypothetical protein